MRQVKIYVISETTKAVAGNFVEFYENPSYAVPDVHIYTRDESGHSVHDDEVAVVSKTPFKISASVHRYRDVDGGETFFALHPRVAELLATPASLDVVARARAEALETVRRAEERAANLERANRLGEGALLELRRQCSDLELSRWVFLSQPWFVRIWRALRREV